MEELLALKKKVNELIEEDTKQLLALGYTQEDLDILDEALEYISYPIVNEYFERHTESEEENQEEQII